MSRASEEALGSLWLVGQSRMAKRKGDVSEQEIAKFLKEERKKVDNENEEKKAKEEEKLAKYENEPELQEEEDDVVEIFQEDDEAKLKLTTTLKDHIKHWEETGASNFCLNVIKQGYKMKLEDWDETTEYQEKNNKSYFENQEFANKAVDTMAKYGVVKRVETAKCINPLTVAINKAGKKRLCLDLSRKVNAHSKAPKFKIRSLKEVANMVEPEDYGFSFDLRSFYHQIPICREQRTLLGFAITREEGGEEEVYVFTQIPFGLNDAARCVTKMMKGPLERWRGWGARVAEVHIDDGIVFAAGRSFTLDLSRRVRDDLGRYGLLISEDKCAWGARRNILWVGFTWDTVRFKMFLPEEKVARLLGRVDELTRQANKLVPIKQLAGVCSLLTSLRPALGDMTRFRSRSMLQLVAKAQERFGWGGGVRLDNKAMDELKFWRENVERLNGFPIRPRAGLAELKQRWFVSDAGEFQIGGVEWSLGGRVEGTDYQVRLTKEEQLGSSTEREMIGMRAGLRLNVAGLEGCEVRWTCDNKAVSIIMRVGSMKPWLQELALDIHTLCGEHGVTLDVDWQPREMELVRWADAISKDFDASDFAISAKDFSALQKEFGEFSCDFFASSATYRMKPFMSRYRCEGSSGADAFSAGWGEGFGYFHPPVHRIVDTVRYAREQKAKGILVVPCWQGAAFWAFIKAEGGIRERRRFRPFLEAPEYFRNKTFAGTPKFDFSIFEFVF